MGKTLEIRWHARAGQGAVTAAKTFAEAALGEGKYIQASPEYGPERAGAPMRAFNRVTDVTVVTVFPDDNKKYLSIDLLREEPVKPDFLAPHVELEVFDAFRWV